MTPSVADTLALLHTFDPGAGPMARRSIEQTARLLHDAPAPFSRTAYDPGHITASALVLAPEGGEVLLVHHRRFDRWLQPGGHVDRGDQSVIATAVREVTEETGVSLDETPPVLVAVDVHRIPPARGEPFHLHHDLMFRLRAAERSARRAAQAVRWVPVAQVARLYGDAALVGGLERALALEERP